MSLVKHLKSLAKLGTAKKTDLVEGKMAHEYQDYKIRAQISQNYQRRYRIEPDPVTDPLRYDPLNPPKEWAYDPYNEEWVKQND